MIGSAAEYREALTPGHFWSTLLEGRHVSSDAALVDGVPVSDLCDEYQLQPTLFYNWQKQFFENGAAAFQKSGRKAKDVQAERIAALERKLAKKN